MNFSELLINSIRGEIESLEMELNYIHNKESISPMKKVERVRKILLNISEKKNILSLYLNYILESKQNTQNGDDNQ
jgi:hypothetical protein